jgi:hypothetical protein
VVSAFHEEHEVTHFTRSALFVLPGIGTSSRSRLELYILLPCDRPLVWKATGLP